MEIMASTDFKAETSSWKEELKNQLPYLGHRNWIVITDMAYPLQTQPGIKTFVAEESYVDILRFVYNEIEESSHIKATIYQDKELSFLSDEDAEGVENLKEEMKNLLGNHVITMPHEDLIDRLDEVSKMFSVMIIKSKLTIPYTTTFFELDCNYWDGRRQNRLQERMHKQERIDTE